MSTKKKKYLDGPKGPATPVDKTNLTDKTLRTSGYLAPVPVAILAIVLVKLDVDARSFIATFMKLLELAAQV